MTPPDGYARLAEMLHARCSKPIAEQLLEGIQRWAADFPRPGDEAARREMGDITARLDHARQYATDVGLDRLIDILDGKAADRA